ncbi:hypothetical protein LK996_09595 [Lysobacter sp. A6]|uniref:Replication protein n=1 Tax=Noviluteimonas lactosilytica TaxID=2888523 RepID=A0ABS8JIC2_9GAMM|nr:hypothetical protein [Lysobacter lactosilyticus]MCC8363325.1 hypothetical protein [Lysobacter lactosilyticus]
MRARNIKPGFFENEVLATLPHWVRLLFAGLWCLADRGGRLEDRPARVHRALFAGEALDVDSGLSMLADAGFIARYTVDGVSCIQVLAWDRHQSPHMKERESDLPPMPGRKVRPDQADGVVVGCAQCLPGAGTDHAQCVPGTATGQAPEHDGARPPDSLIADSQSIDSAFKASGTTPNKSAATGNAVPARTHAGPNRSTRTKEKPYVSPGAAALMNKESPAENQAAYERHLRDMDCEP